jgi:hypothetical protein
LLPALPYLLDLHANLTDAMVRHASVLEFYRTYPHVDIGETGAPTGLMSRHEAGGTSSQVSGLGQGDWLLVAEPDRRVATRLDAVYTSRKHHPECWIDSSAS